MGSDKGSWGRYGLQAFGISVLGPLLFYILNPIIEHFKGNRNAIAYTKTYVSQWDSIKIALPTNLYDFSSGEFTHRTKVLTGDGKQKQRIFASFEKYYIPQYKKYFVLESYGAPFSISIDTNSLCRSPKVYIVVNKG